MRISDWSSDVCSSDLASGWLHIDMAEKLARQEHAARMQAAAPPTAPIAGGDELRDGHANDDAEEAPEAPPGFGNDPAPATSPGLDEERRRALPRRVGRPEERSRGDDWERPGRSGWVPAA